jgi:predicted TIM-barrel fold metal-dependent hydrolase
MTGGASSQTVPDGQSPIKSYFDAVLELLGLKGLMFGSDRPVLTLACDYSAGLMYFTG